MQVKLESVTTRECCKCCSKLDNENQRVSEIEKIQKEADQKAKQNYDL